MKWTDEHYARPDGSCRRLQVDMDGRLWEHGGEVTTLTRCSAPGPHPHAARHPMMPPPWTPRTPPTPKSRR